jgi:alcohol dehydrogenase, propanol-preferring
VRIEASGLCHTDIHAAHGDWPVKPSPPFVPGHEGVGTVVALGPGVTHRALGDRVAIAWLGHACGHCDYCVKGWETLCLEQRNSGYSVDGAFAEFAVADADYVVPVPAAVSSFDASPPAPAPRGRGRHTSRRTPAAVGGQGRRTLAQPGPVPSSRANTMTLLR